LSVFFAMLVEFHDEALVAENSCDGAAHVGSSHDRINLSLWSLSSTCRGVIHWQEHPFYPSPPIYNNIT